MKVCRLECPYCGGNIEANIENRKMVFCTYCGKQILLKNDSKEVTINQNISINQRVTNEAEILKEQNRHRENKWKLIIMCLLFVFAVGGISVLFRVFSKKTAETNPQVKEEIASNDNQNNNDTAPAQEKDSQPKSSQDTSKKKNASEKEQGKQKIELVDSGYSVGRSGNYVTVNYAVKIHNPNDEYAVMFPTIVITARSADGAILTTDSQILNGIAAGDTVLYGNEVFYEGAVPATVEISVKTENNDYTYVLQDGSEYIRQDQLVISNVSEHSGSLYKTITGEITNNSSEDLNAVVVIVIFKEKGKMKGGIRTYLQQLDSGDTVPFEVQNDSDVDYDSYEVYGMQW